MGASVIIGATLAAAAATGGIQAFQARQQRKTAEKGAKEQAQAAVKLSKEEKQARASAAQRRLRRRGAATAEAGPRDTVLTGAQGLAPGTPVGGKTLLGA